MATVVLSLAKSREFSWLFVTPNESTADNTPFTHGIWIAFSNGVPMLKIQRTIESGTVRLILIGRISAPQLPDLRDLILSEAAREVVLDLTEVTLVDREVVHFLVRCEANGLRVTNCPGYIREWMGRESRTR